MRLNTSNIAIIKRLLTGQNSRPLKSILRKCEPADIATLFNLYPAKESHYLTAALIATGQASEVLREVPEPQLKSILEKLGKNIKRSLYSDFPEDDCAFFLGLLDDDDKDEIFALVDHRRAERLQQILSYPEDTAGRIMNTIVFSLPEGLNAKEGVNSGQ